MEGVIVETDEPYKGYWILPSGIIDNDKTLEETLEIAVSEQVGLSNLTYEECAVFSDLDRFPNKRIIGISAISMVDEVTVRNHQEATKYEYSWFSIDKLPKIGYDHIRVINKSIVALKQNLTNSSTLRQVFPSDFTLPEIQSVYEQLLTKDLDRRNFRKKFLNLNLIEETGDNAPSNNGRPAKLYRFKQDMDDIVLF